MKEFRKRYWYEIALCASLFPLIYSPFAYTADVEVAENPVIAASDHPNVDVDKDTYTVNFNNIAIIEFIRFASKITNLNFVFEEGDLQFAVTVVSEEAVSAKNVMSALSQVLRMHDLTLIEQDGNVLITKSKNVNQIAPIVSSDLPDSKAANSALITRVFRLKNANVNTIAGIIRPMCSAAALIEVSIETRQLIVTDVTTSVEQIASLLTSLDAPHTPLDVENYVVKNIPPQDLIAMTQQILNPFTEGNPLILVPQNETNSIFVVSTPYLIERAMTVMEDLDHPAKSVVISRQSMTGKNIFMYTTVNRSADELLRELGQVNKQLKSIGGPKTPLQIAIDSAKPIQDTNSLMFVADADTTVTLKEILSSLDVNPGQVRGSHQAQAKSSFLVYNPKFRSGTELQEELTEIGQKLEDSGLADPSFLQTLESMKWVSSTNSLVFTGDPKSLAHVNSLLAEFDSSAAAAAGAHAFLIYKPKYLSAQDIEAALTDLSADLEKAGLKDPVLFQTLQSMRYVPQTDSLLFTGSQDGLDKVQNLINGIDTSTALGAIQRIGNLTFYLYKIQYASPDKLISSLKVFANELKQTNAQDKQLADTINHVKWIKETNSLLFTGNADTLERIDQLVKKFDLPTLGGSAPVERAASIFVIYNPKYIHGEELISILCDFMQNLMHSGVSDPGLFDAINNLKWIPKTSTLLVSGDQASVDKVQQLLAKFDVPGKESVSPSIESIDNTSFLVYKLQFHPGDDIQNALKQVAVSLSKGSASPTALVDAINSLQWIQVTNSLLCSGQQDVLVKLKDLIQNLDIPLRQVFIEVLVIQTGLLNAQDFGLAWGGKAQYFNKAALSTGNFPTTLNNPANAGSSGNPSPASTFSNNLTTINAVTTPTPQLIPFAQGFDLGVIGDIIMHKGKSFISFGALVNAIQLDTDSTILLNPKIVTQDNRQSSIFVGTNVPYTGSLVTSNATQITSNANIEYRDVGVSLTITPILGDGDVVTLEIVNDISQVISGRHDDLFHSIDRDHHQATPTWKRASMSLTTISSL